MSTIFSATVALSAALMHGSGVANAAPQGGLAPPWLGCALTWNDQNTAGITCTGGTFIGVALCADGRPLTGAAAARGTTSYVYCSSANSALHLPVLWGALPA
ncbi:hypothetical protein ACFVMC_30415 [Nocardia sp. NPDC127579]|uniref:hypothetical protein n=1 Tax=Nocardia sp. NPDC127579 TaxID=3345402 RepID=UPI00362E3C3E